MNINDFYLKIDELKRKEFISEFEAFEMENLLKKIVEERDSFEREYNNLDNEAYAVGSQDRY
jgi:hypothetical protein